MNIGAFAHMMPHIVTIETWAGTDASGYDNPTYGAALVVQSRIVMKNQMIKDAQGREVVSRGQIYLLTTVVPTLKDRVTLPAPFLPLNPVLVSVQPRSDDTGPCYVEAYF